MLSFSWQAPRTETTAGISYSRAIIELCDKNPPDSAIMAPALVKSDRSDAFPVKLIRIHSEKVSIPDEAAARNIVEDLEGRTFSIDGIKRKEVKKNPQPPFITTRFANIYALKNISLLYILLSNLEHKD